DDAPAYLVESGAYPDGASVGSAAGIVLKDGNGGLRLVTCPVPVPVQVGMVEVEFENWGLSVLEERPRLMRYRSRTGG
ncbi:MAG: hypothetical protein K0Q52_3537, partial [Microbacterium sp.]|nr:hypothetical protein [Microbacterium sp.]